VWKIHAVSPETTGLNRFKPFPSVVIGQRSGSVSQGWFKPIKTSFLRSCSSTGSNRRRTGEQTDFLGIGRLRGTGR